MQVLRLGELFSLSFGLIYVLVWFIFSRIRAVDPLYMIRPTYSAQQSQAAGEMIGTCVCEV